MILMLHEWIAGQPHTRRRRSFFLQQDALEGALDGKDAVFDAAAAVAAAGQRRPHEPAALDGLPPRLHAPQLGPQRPLLTFLQTDRTDLR